MRRVNRGNKHARMYMIIKCMYHCGLRHSSGEAYTKRIVGARALVPVNSSGVTVPPAPFGEGGYARKRHGITGRRRLQ